MPKNSQIVISMKSLSKRFDDEAGVLDALKNINIEMTK